VIEMAERAVDKEVFLAYSRHDEAEADALGERLMFEAGYNPMAMANFFARMRKKDGRESDFQKFMSNHPSPGDREKKIAAEAHRLGPSKGLVWNTPEFEKIHAIVASLKYPKKK